MPLIVVFGAKVLDVAVVVAFISIVIIGSIVNLPV